MVFLNRIILFLFILISPTQIQAQENKVPNITIENAYAFSTAENAKTGAAFMIIKNTGDQDDTLIEAKSNIAEITELHENTIDPDDGVMMMRKIKNIIVPAGENAVLEPKGKHVMLIKLNEALTLGNSVSLILTFEKSGDIPVQVDIIPLGTTPKKKEAEVSDKDDSDFPEHSFSHESHHF